MAKLIAVDNKTHKNLKINTSKQELHGAELNLIPVVMTEFINLIVEYPIVLTKNGDTGQFSFAAMLGFEAHENLFFQGGKWQGLYLPLHIQRQPFFVGDPSNNITTKKEDYVVCIDMDSPTVTEVNANSLTEDINKDSLSKTSFEALFDEKGAETPYFQNAKSCLGQLLQGEIDNECLINALQSLDLLQSLSLEVTFVNDQSTRLNGLYTVDSDKLSALNGEQITSLHEAELLPAIYTMSASLGQIYALINKKNMFIHGVTTEGVTEQVNG